MLNNTRGRTVFACQPKRLPKDIDRLSFYPGTIVRKKSLSKLDQGFCGGVAFTPPLRATVTECKAENVRAVIEDLKSCAAALPPRTPHRPPPLGDDTSPFAGSQSSPLPYTTLKGAEATKASTGAQASPTPRLQRSPSLPMRPPPPLPGFPSDWKPEPAVPLRKVAAAAASGGDGPALRPTPKPSRERDAYSLALGDVPPETTPSPKAAAGQSLLSAALSPSSKDKRGQEDKDFEENARSPALRRSPSMPLPQRPKDACDRRRPRPKTSALTELNRPWDSSRVRQSAAPQRPKTAEPAASGSCTPSSTVELAQKPQPRTPAAANTSSCIESSMIAEDSIPLSQRHESRRAVPSRETETGVISPSGGLGDNLLSPVATHDQTFPNEALQGSMLSPKAQQGRALFLSAVDNDTLSASLEFNESEVLQPHAFVDDLAPACVLVA